jgi:hypothetical protein
MPCDHPPALVHVEWVCLAGGAAEGGVAAAAQGVARLQRGAAAQAQRYSAAPRIARIRLLSVLELRAVRCLKMI